MEFQRLLPGEIPRYRQYFEDQPGRGCEYSPVNLMAWGRQQVHFGENFVSFFSQFDRVSVYPFPVGTGNLQPVLEALFADAKTRGIPCRLTGLTQADCQTLEALYPGKFRFHPDRNAWDYVYDIKKLATLKGKRLQSKRNYVNRFYAAHPTAAALPLTADNLCLATELADRWYDARQLEDPAGDFSLEQVALDRVLARWNSLPLEGMVLLEGGTPLAMTVGSPLSSTVFDVHFEKALDRLDGAYAAINQAFAAYLHEKFPALQYLNREDDMGIPGLRKAKLSYHPDFFVEKYWARLWEDDDEI